MRRALESCQFHILSLMLCWSHLELRETTELRLISLKQKQMLLHVCVCVQECVCLGVCILPCRRPWACVCVFDWHVVDLLGTAFFGPPQCLSTADDGQLICGPEISVFKKEVSQRHAATDLNWSHLVRLLWQNMCVGLVMRTGQALSRDRHPWETRFERLVTAAFWACNWTCGNTMKTFALALLKAATKITPDWCRDKVVPFSRSCGFDYKLVMRLRSCAADEEKWKSFCGFSHHVWIRKC